jgi:predicted molibdopterin-dependent oxidoreductase YjgC
MAQTLTTCTFCGAGCGLYLETAGNRVRGVYPSMSHPANQGRICVRGWHVHEVASSPDRLRRPLIRRRSGFEEVTWDEALAFLAKRMQEIRAQHGPDAFAFFSSPRCSNEESYLLQKLARALIGTNNVDHGAGVYCHNSVETLLEMLGVAATTNSIADLARSEVILVDGVDLARQLPTIAGVVIRAKLNGAKLIVIDVRRHRVAEQADLFLQLKPGTEALLYGGMAKVIVDHALPNLAFIKDRCQGFDELLNQAREYDLLETSELCGVPAELIEAAALAYARARAAALLYSTGIETPGPEAAQARVNLALLCGQLGKPGAGLFALTEHNNLQGVCDMGMLPSRLPGYRPVAHDTARAEVERAWKVKLPPSPGWAAPSVLSHRGHGKVRAIWLCRYDPVTTAFFGDAPKALEQCDLVVVQHLFRTETSRYAHVVLPAAAFGEEQVTFTSTERRIQLTAKVLEPIGEALPAWEQLVRVGQALGADWSYRSAGEVMDEIREVIPFYRGASYANLAHEYGRQWPCTEECPLGQPWLFSEDLTRDGQTRRFKFRPVRRASVARAPVAPMTLLFGHSLYYWHQNVLIQHSETLKREYRILLLDYPEGFVEINTADAKQLGVRDGETIRLCAGDRSALTTARVTPEVRAGTVFVPYFVRQVQQQIRGSAENGIEFGPVRIEKEAS